MNTLDQRIQSTLRQDVQSMHAYAVQPSDGMVKLDTMENPHRLPQHLRQALGECVHAGASSRSGPTKKGLRILTPSISWSCCRSSVNR